MAATTTKARRQHSNTLGDLLAALDKDASVKAAAVNGNKKAEKKADANSEPGGYSGATTHPSKSVDDGTQTAPEGSHSAENETRVKEDEPMGVPHANSNDSGSQNDVQVDMGLTSKSTGTDTAVERDVKDRPDDPGTSSPVDTSVGEKYSEFQKLAKATEQAGSQFLAVLTKLAEGTPAPAATPAKTEPEKKAEQKPADAKSCNPPEATPAKEAAEGYELAGAIASLPVEDKEATVNAIYGLVHQQVARAADLAVKTAEYMQGVYAGIKQAEEPPPEEGKEKEEEPSEGGGGGPPSSDGGGGGDPFGGGGGDAGAGSGQPSEDQLLQMLLGGDQMGAGAAAGGMGGEGGGMGGDLAALLGGGGGAGGGGGDPMAGGGMDGGMGGGDPMAGGMGGGDPMAGGGMGGGDPMAGGMGGGDPMAGGGQQIDPAMLEAILQQLGASSGDMQKAMAAKQAQIKQAQANKNASARKDAALRAKYGPKYDTVKKAVADLLGRK